MATLSTVETDAKALAAKAVVDATTALAKAKAELATLEGKSYSFKTVGIVGAVAFALGFLVHFL